METPGEPSSRTRFVEDLVDRAWSLPPEQRERFVRERAATDAELADEVLEVLAAADDADRDLLGGEDRIGRYAVRSKLGEGGMGIVYLAEQSQPLRRHVALKVLKPGMDSKAFLARFDAERQALALMEHSCIARIYEAGVTEAGRPFLAMEYVKGEPLTRYCDAQRLDLRRRIEIFLRVCSAMQHAHTKGVIHRDLKPSNILVSEQDGEPCPKVIDFGIAKAVDHRLVDATVFTETGQILGTPEYMSPEQAGVGRLDIDTRADVFSLGVLLYELLTGTLPLTRDVLLQDGVGGVKNVLQETEQPRASTRITTLGDAAESSAKKRRVPIDELRRRLRGDLDWIVMRAIDRDRSRRYTTVQALADDLQRHLADEPVSAGPPSATYLLGKLFRRHRGKFAAALAAALALTIGLALALWQWRVAEDRAQSEATAKDQVIVERDRANRALLLVRIGEAEREAEDFIERAEHADTLGAWVTEADGWRARLPEFRQLLAKTAATGHDDGESLRFEDPGSADDHKTLSALVASIERLSAPDGLLERTRESHDWAQRVLRETIDDRRNTWDDAIAAVAAHDAFGGLRLTPQEGLVPIGTDADSGLPLFWMPRSGEEPRMDSRGAIAPHDRMGLVFVLLPGGTTRIGAVPGIGLDQATPVREVQLSPFFLAKYEMTRHQYQVLAKAEDPSYYRNQVGLEWPVDTVKHEEAVPLLRRYGLLLPTEAQWEYACRAGTATQWWFGDERTNLIDHRGIGRINAADGYYSRGNNTDSVSPNASSWKEYDDRCSGAARVGLFEPNGFGLHDMHGNLFELTRGAGVRNYARAVFGSGDGLIESSSTSSVIMRGGSYNRSVEEARSAYRRFIGVAAAWSDLGLRAARAID